MSKEIKISMEDAMDVVSAIDYRIAQCSINIMNCQVVVLKHHYQIEKSNLELVREKILNQVKE